MVSCMGSGWWAATRFANRQLVYITYSKDLLGGWSTPRSIYQIATLPTGYNYAFHAFANYDSTGKVIPIAWTQYAPPNTYYIGMANVTFA